MTSSFTYLEPAQIPTAGRLAAKAEAYARLQRRRLATIGVLLTLTMVLVGAVRGLPGGATTTAATGDTMPVGATADTVDADVARSAAERVETSKTHTVRPGDTVWSIASEIAGDTDPRPVVDAILARNALSPAPLEPGTVLTLPDP